MKQEERWMYDIIIGLLMAFGGWGKAGELFLCISEYHSVLSVIFFKMDSNSTWFLLIYVCRAVKIDK